MAAEERELVESAEVTEEAGRSVLLRVQGRPLPEASWQKLEGEGDPRCRFATLPAATERSPMHDSMAQGQICTHG